MQYHISGPDKSSDPDMLFVPDKSFVPAKWGYNLPLSFLSVFGLDLTLINDVIEI